MLARAARGEGSVPRVSARVVADASRRRRAPRRGGRPRPGRASQGGQVLAQRVRGGQLLELGDDVGGAARPDGAGRRRSGSACSRRSSRRARPDAVRVRRPSSGSGSPRHSASASSNSVGGLGVAAGLSRPPTPRAASRAKRTASTASGASGEPVPGRRLLDELGAAEGPAQPGDQRLQAVRRVRGRVRRPRSCR